MQDDTSPLVVDASAPPPSDAIVAEYRRLREAGDAEAASRFYAEHGVHRRARATWSPQGGTP